MRASIRVVFDSDSDGQLLVVVAEFCHKEGLWFPPRVQVIMRCRSFEHLHHVLSVIVLTRPLNEQVRRITPKAKELSGEELRRDLKLNDVLSLFDFIGPDNKLASIESVFDFFTALFLLW